MVYVSRVRNNLLVSAAAAMALGLVVWHGISVTYLWGPLCGGREGGVFVGGDALE